MRNVFSVLMVICASWMVCGCGRQTVADQRHAHENGVYRGAFIDGDSIQVNVEIVLRDGVVQEAKFRHLRVDDNYNLDATESPYQLVIQQYQEALDHLIGKDLETHLPDLYTPQNIVTTQVDGYTSATIRSNKIISAIRDALNRGVYSHR